MAGHIYGQVSATAGAASAPRRSMLRRDGWSNWRGPVRVMPSVPAQPIDQPSSAPRATLNDGFEPNPESDLALESINAELAQLHEQLCDEMAAACADSLAAAFQSSAPASRFWDVSPSEHCRADDRDWDAWAVDAQSVSADGDSSELASVALNDYFDPEQAEIEALRALFERG